MRRRKGPIDRVILALPESFDEMWIYAGTLEMGRTVVVGDPISNEFEICPICPGAWEVWMLMDLPNTGPNRTLYSVVAFNPSNFILGGQWSAEKFRSSNGASTFGLFAMEVFEQEEFFFAHRERVEDIRQKLGCQLNEDTSGLSDLHCLMFEAQVRGWTHSILPNRTGFIVDARKERYETSVFWYNDNPLHLIATDFHHMHIDTFDVMLKRLMSDVRLQHQSAN